MAKIDLRAACLICFNSLLAIGRKLSFLTGATAVPSAEQCREYAAECNAKAKEGRISARRCSVLMNVARSWTALAHQLESLTDIVKDEAK
ncbi:hypothetical protein ABIB90_004004 [Bradyrhizobium sp. JR4.1]|uniref:hypothetical protein n=1 Tax=Bradyrhizobium sp. JR4.1 TaxID=3156372 RepID=UPI0033912F96